MFAYGTPVSLLRSLGLTAALVAALSCAGLAHAEEDAPLDGETPLVEQEAEAPVEESQPAEVLPDVPLTREILYQLLMSEIAAQRGVSEAAFSTEFSLARKTRDPRIARRALEFGLLARQPALALQAARLWLDISPASVEAKDALVTLLLMTDRLDEATPYLQREIDTAESKAEAIMQTQSLLARAAKPERAFSLLETLTSSYLGLPESHLALAQSADAAGDKVRAADEARKALALRPDWTAAAILTAQYLQAIDPSRADALLAEFLARSPHDVEARTAYARLLIQQDRFDDATRQFERLLKDRPNHPETLYVLGLLSYEAKRLDSAESFLNRYLASVKKGGAPDDRGDSAILYLAQIAEDRKDHDKALALLARIEEGDRYIDANVRRALILSRIGKPDDGMALLRTLPAQSTDEKVRIILAQAQLLYDSKQYRAAFDLISAEQEKLPDNPELLYERGMAAERIGQFDVMEASWRALINLQPDEAHGYNALGYTLADRNTRLPEALALIEKALALAPDDAAILDSMGWVQYRMGNTVRALEYLARAFTLRPDVEIGAHYGEVLWVAGQRDMAEKVWRKALGLDPENQVLRNTLARFNVDLGKH